MTSVRQIKRTDGIVEKLSITGNEAGALAGKTFVVKDLFDVKGRTTGGGNPDWQRKHVPAEANAAAVQILLDAGARLEGVSCSDEFAFSIDGINIHYGAPVNPQFSDRVSGGSSSGSASAVAAGLVDFAMGTDTAGSVRVPASYCGIFGIRPTQGRISTQGVMPLSESIDAPGWFAKDASTLRLVGEVLLRDGIDAAAGANASHSTANPTGASAGPGVFTRMLIGLDAFALAEPGFAADLSQSVERLLGLFEYVEEIELAGMHWETFPDHLNRIRGWECTQYYSAWMDENKPDLAADIAARFASSRRITKEEHDASLAFADDLTSQFDKLLGDNTVLCIPTVCSLPPHVYANSEELQKNRGSNLKLTAIASVARLPQISVPVPLQIGCKFGLSFIANRNLDLDLLRLGERISEVIG